HPGRSATAPSSRAPARRTSGVELEPLVLDAGEILVVVSQAEQSRRAPLDGTFEKAPQVVQLQDPKLGTALVWEGDEAKPVEQLASLRLGGARRDLLDLEAGPPRRRAHALVERGSPALTGGGRSGMEAPFLRPASQRDARDDRLAAAGVALFHHLEEFAEDGRGRDGIPGLLVAPHVAEHELFARAEQ